MDGLHINSGSVLINTKRHGQRNNRKGNDLPNSGSFECSKQSILSSMDKFVRTVQSMRNTILVPSRLRDMNLRQRLPDCQISTLIENSSNGNKMMKNNKNSNSHSTTKHNYQSSNSHYHSHHSSYHLLHRNHLLQDYHLGYSHYNTQSLTNSSTSLENDFNNRLNYDPAEIPSALMNADLFNFYSMLYDVKQQLLWGPASGQSTIFTNYSTNTDLNQLNSTMANCNLNNSDNQTSLNSIKHSNRAESTCSSGYSSNSSTRNSTTNLSFIAQSQPTTPTTANTIQQHLIQSTNGSTNSLSTPLQLRSVTNQDDVKLTMNLNNNQLNDSTSSTVSSNASTISNDSTDGKLVSVVDSPQSKTPQSDSDLESELGSDSILTDRTSSEQITDQTQLLASAFRHHLQALHTILDQLTHSAEYLSRNYELDLDENTN